MSECVSISWDNLPAQAFDSWAEVLEREKLDLSLHPTWLAAIADARGMRARIEVFEAGSPGNSGWLPYFIDRHWMHGVPVRILEPATNLVSYHPEVIGLSAHPGMLDAFLHHHAPAWDAFHFASLQPEGPSAAALREVAQKYGMRVLAYPGESSPYLPIEGDWESLMKTYSHKFRYNLKRKKKKVSEVGKAEERWFTGGADVPALLEAMLTVEGSSWKQKAGMAVGTGSAERRYYERLLPFLAGIGALAANVLFIDGRPLAYSLCYRWRGRWGQMKTSFDNQFRHLSLGTLVNMTAIHRACEMGDREFDFLGHAMPHKLEWTKNVRPHCNYFVYSRTLRGRLLGTVKALRERFRRNDVHGGETSRPEDQSDRDEP